MTLSRIFKTIFLIEFVKGLILAIKELFRKSKTSNLKGDIKKAKKTFNYKVKTHLKEVIRIMMDDELKKYSHPPIIK